ncbi:hypothetical protein [Streptomyces sp. NPDC006012]|uniref:hypothetical protein n=1 Tax=Streptomyces sp. NPDC006012 TaxID=3364739 RepID=UPI0036AF2846
MPRPTAAELPEEEKEFWEETRDVVYKNDQRNATRKNTHELAEAWERGYRSGLKNHRATYSEIHGYDRSVQALANTALKNHEIYWNPDLWVHHMHRAGYEFGALEKEYGSRDAALQEKIDRLWQPVDRPARPESDATLAVRRTANRFATWLSEIKGIAQNRDTRDARAAGAPLGSGGAAAESTERLLPSAASVASLLPEGTGTQWSRPAPPTQGQSAATPRHIALDLGRARNTRSAR